MIGRKATTYNTDDYGHHATVKSLITGVKKVITKFTWTISFPLQIYSKTCIQELSIPVVLSERNNNKLPGDSDSRTLNLKGADIYDNVRVTVLTEATCQLSHEGGLHFTIPAQEVYDQSMKSCSAVTPPFFLPSLHRHAQGVDRAQGPVLLRRLSISNTCM
jgi:hypothetical protein